MEKRVKKKWKGRYNDAIPLGYKANVEFAKEFGEDLMGINKTNLMEHTIRLEEDLYEITTYEYY